MQDIQSIIFQIRSTHEAAFAIENYFIASGASGVTTIDKAEFVQTLQEQASPDLIIEDFLDNLDPEVIIEAYFPYRNDQIQIYREFNLREKIAQDIEKDWITIKEFEKMLGESLDRIAEFLNIGQGYLGYKFIEEQDWAENWKKFYNTLTIGKIVINPSWIDYHPKSDEILLNLDPGSAFGTGEHASTALVLKYLSDYKFADLPEGPILDLGTGSGVLAIAASKIFEGREIVAVDIDTHSVNVAIENAKHNAVHNVIFRTGELSDLEGKYSLILANLIAKLHINLADDYFTKLLPGGYIIISGIIEKYVREVKAKFAQKGFALILESSENDWSALIYQKQTRGS